MPRTLDIKNSFITGEVSPNLLGRTDLAKYQSACEELTNFIPRIQGGVSRRPGLRFIAPSLFPGRLIPFIFSATNSYVLLFTNSAIFFFTNDGQIIDPDTDLPYFIHSPYLFADDFEKIKIAQIADTMYLTHPKYPIMKLSRLSDTNWVLTQPEFFAVPATQQDSQIANDTTTISPTTRISLDSFTPASAGLTGKGIITCSDYVFLDLPGIIGSVIVAGTGHAIITGLYGIGKKIHFSDPYFSYNQVSVQITIPFDVPHYTVWTINGNPKTSSIDITGNLVSLGDFIVSASKPVFIQGDVGRRLVAGTGVGVIVAVQGTTALDVSTTATMYQEAVITPIDPFNKSSYDASEWFLRGGPSSYFAAGTLEVVSGPLKFWHGETQFGIGSIFEVRSATKHPTDSTFQTVVSGSTYVNVQYLDGFTDTFRTADVGRYVSFSGGYAIIVKVTNATTITVRLLAPIATSETNGHGQLIVAVASPGTWYYEDKAFSEMLGYPNAICYFQDRLWLGGTVNDPQSIWASAIGDYENFAKGILDDDGLQVVVASGNFDEILWMQPYQGNVVAGTFRSEYVISAGTTTAAFGQNNQAITPSNAAVTFQSAYGVTQIQPKIIQEVLFYVQRSQKTVYEMEFNIQNALYASKNLNILHDLVSKTPIIEMDYQENPYKVAWMIASDLVFRPDNVSIGQNLIGLTYDRGQDVFAWHRHFSGLNQDDSFVSLCAIPNNVNDVITDEIWVMMKRRLNDNVFYTIELFDLSLLVDYATHTVFNDPVTQLIDLDYLIGFDVYVVADGCLLGPYHINNDATIDFPAGFSAKDVQVGLNFNSKIITVRPELAQQRTVQGIVKRWNKIWIRVYNTLNVKVNNQRIPNRDPLTLLGQQVDLFTGDEGIQNLGYDRDGRIIIEQDLPMPTNILAQFGQIMIGEN